MIKVIKRGKPYEEIVNLYKVTCPKCGAVMECEKDDTRFVPLPPYDTYGFIRCPCCIKSVIKVDFNKDSIGTQRRPVKVKGATKNDNPEDKKAED